METEDQAIFSVKRRRGDEPPRCRVPDCLEELPSGYHAKQRICPRHFKAPSVHVAGDAWRYCQRCARFQTLEAFAGDKRSCNPSLSKHNKRRRGVPRSRTGAGSGGSDLGSGGSRTVRSSSPASPTIDTAGLASSLKPGSNGNASPPTAAAAAAPAEGSNRSSVPLHGSSSSHESLREAGQPQRTAPPAPMLPLQPELAPTGLPWPAPTEPPRPVHQGGAQSAPRSSAGWRSDDGGLFDSALQGLLLSGPLQRPAGEDGQVHAHAALLDAYNNLLSGACDAPSAPSPRELVEIAGQLGIRLPGHLGVNAHAAGVPQGPPALPSDSDLLDNAGAACQTSSGAMASSSSNAAVLPQFLGVPAGASAAVAAAAQAATAAGLPAVPAWQLQTALRPHGGEQGSSRLLMGSYASPFQLERLSFKVFGCHPDQLAPDVRSELHSILGVHPQHMEGCIRPGCTFLTVDLRLDEERAATLMGTSGSSSKQPDGTGGRVETGAASSTGRALMLQRLGHQLLQRRSLGKDGSAGPMLLQLNTQHLAVAAGGRLLRCMPLVAHAPSQAAEAVPPVPAIPHLSSVSPSVLVLPSLPPSSSGCEPAVLALTGHGLWDHAGAPGLVLCRQHGRHLPVEVWGSTSGSNGGAGALVVAVLGVRPGVCEIEVQCGSILGSSRPLLVLPADLEAAAAELRAPQGGDAGDALLRDVGAVAAWVAHHEQGPVQLAHASFCSDNVLSSGWSSSEEDAEDEGAQAHGESWVPRLPATSVAHLAKHAAAYSKRCGWQATAAALELAATAAQAAAGVEAAAAAAAPAAPPPGWLPGRALPGTASALDFEYWLPLWEQQLQREERQPLPPTGPDSKPTAWWQASAGDATLPERRQLPEERCDALTVEAIKTALGARGPGRSAWALGGRAMAAVLLALVTAAALALVCTRV